ncbi:hypothetical protein ACHHYP_15658 [Achlya hypogyna]|uniref:Transmembrane protein n=1 Tax=Achlya hypogyna TaxID=1202772 RepID=A0A1V9YAF8_ACHHY|nr:hypothetical protein ACHHYP_15658 [Achlya hypogyna]
MTNVQEEHAGYSISMSPRGKKAGLRQWYVGDEELAPKRYCGGRLRRGPFICVHVALLVVLLLAIIVPIITAVVLPHAIRAKFAAALAGTGAASTTFNVTDNANGDFTITTTVGAATFIPGTAEIQGPFSLQLTDAAGKGWGRITVADTVAFPVNKDAVVVVPARMVVYDAPSASVLSDVLSTKKFATTVSTQWTIKIWGFTWYHDLELSGVKTVQMSQTLQEKFVGMLTSTSATKTTMEMVTGHGRNNLRINTTMTALSTVPGTVTLVAPTVFQIADVQGTGYANATFENITFPVYQPAELSVYGNLNIYKMPGASLVASILLGQNVSMVVSTHVTIELYNRVWYDRYPLSATVNVNSLLGAVLKGALNLG